MDHRGKPSDAELATALTRLVSLARDMLSSGQTNPDDDLRSAFEAFVLGAGALLPRPVDSEAKTLEASFVSFVDQARSLFDGLSPNDEMEKAAAFLNQASHALDQDVCTKLDLVGKWVSGSWSVYDEVNIFSVLDIARQENPQSLFLAWLLSPDGSHGFEDAFLSRFLARACKLCGVSYAGIKLGSVQVTAQKSAEDAGVPDIELTGENIVCVIENKVGAGETRRRGESQLKRYADKYGKKAAKLGIEALLLVYLVPTPDKQPSEPRFHQMLYSDIVYTANRTLEQTPCLPEVRCLVEMFIHNIRRSVLREMDELLQARSVVQQISECHRSDQAIKAEMYDTLCRLAAIAIQEMKT